MKKSILFTFLIAAVGGCFGPELEELSFFEVVTGAPEADTELGRIRLSGVLTGLDQGEVSDHGFVWSTSLEQLETAPETANRFSLGSTGQNDVFEWTTNPLSLDSVYFFKAYAIAGERAVYGSAMSFYWGVSVDFLEGQIFNDSVVVLCNIQGLEARQTTVEEYGIAYSIEIADPTITTAATFNIAQQRGFDGLFSCQLPNLAFNTTYHVRPYLKIQDNVYYGNPGTFTVRGGWQRTSDLEAPLTRACMVYTGQKVILGSGSPAPGGGGLQSVYNPAFWEFQPDGAGPWISFSEFPDVLTKRVSAVSFYINDKLYIGTGKYEEPGITYYLSTFFVYDPSTDAWDYDEDFPGNIRNEAVAFVINGKAYVGTGQGENDQGNIDNFKDFYEFDPNRPFGMRWRPVAALPAAATKRTAATGIAFQGKGYLLGGVNGPNELSDNWVFTPPSNDSDPGSWAPHTTFTGKARKYAVGFTIGDKAYYGLGETFNNGELTDFWEYSPTGNSWREVTPFQGEARARAAGVGIGSRGLVAGGDGRRIVNNNYFDPETYADCWFYIPDQQQ